MLSMVGISMLAALSFFAIRPYTLSLRTTFVPLGESSFELRKTVSSRGEMPFVFCAVHENERTAAAATYEFLRQMGGTLFEVRAQGNRHVAFKLKKKTYLFDPNRIFTTMGIAATLRERGRYSDDALTAVNRFATRIVDSLVARKQVIVSMHNSTDGAFSVRSYLPDSTYAKCVRDIYINGGRDEDEFFYVTQKSYFNALRAKGFNVVLQDNKTTEDDGSLSIYCGKRGIKYINIEAQHTHLAEQGEMLQAVYELLKKAAPPAIAARPAVTAIDTTKAKQTSVQKAAEEED